MNSQKILQVVKQKLVNLRKMHDENPKVKEFTHKLNNFLAGKSNDSKK